MWDRFQRLAGVVVWSIVIVIRWYHTQFIAAPAQWWLDNVTSAAEESAKAFLREAFAVTGRVVNGVATWIVSIFLGRGFYTRMQAGQRRSRAWHAFWADGKSGTLNAVAEQAGLIDAHSPSPSPRGRLRSGSGQAQSGWVNLNASAAYLRSCLPFNGGTTATAGGAKMRRSGSDLFDRPSGFAVAERLQRRGLAESTRLSLEIAIETVFNALRAAVRATLRLNTLPRGRLPPGRADGDRHAPRRLLNPAAAAAGGGGSGQRRARSFGSWEDMGVWTASDVILQAGYPLEEHVVTTSDGYIMTMQRLPRKDSREAVFFQHGVLDTSLGWVANGVQGSQAFAAFDRGADVWLGNSRANPPRAHSDPALSGARYWVYSLNELGMEDVAAQVDHIHSVKEAELGSGAAARSGVMASGVVGGRGGTPTPAEVPAVEDDILFVRPRSRPSMHKRSGSDSALAATHHLALAAESGVYSGGAAVQPPNEQQIREHNLAAAAAGRGRSLDGRSPGGRRRSGGLFGMLSKSLDKESDAQQREQREQRQWSSGGRQAEFPAGGTGSSGGGLPPPSPLRRRRSFLRLFSQEPAPPASTAEPTAAERVAAGASSASVLRSFSIPGGAADSDDEAAKQQLQPIPDPVARSSGAACSGKPPRLPVLPPAAHLARKASLDSSATLPSSGRPIRAPTPGLPPSSADPTIGAGDIGGMSSSVEPSPRPTGAQPPDLMTPDRMSYGGQERAVHEEERLERPWAVVGSAAAATAAWDPADAEGARPLHRSATAASFGGGGGGMAPSYRLQAVAHSLGGASLLIYAVMCRVLGRPHHLSRLVLLTPAGFHRKWPSVCAPFYYILPIVMWLLNRFRPDMGTPAYIPSSLLRYITFKLSVDLQQIPALNELTRAALRLLLRGDPSEWDRAVQMPHYAVASMPAISLHSGAHFMQLMATGRFQLYDYGSPAANARRYGTPAPPDVAAHYHLLEGLPIDLVAGRSDGVIALEDVMAHYQAMRAAGLEVTYKELDVGHLDVTFAVKDEVQHYVLRRLRLSGR